VCRKHMMLACGRIRQKRDGLGVRHASQGEEGVHLMLANPPWRQLRERAEKIPRSEHDYELGGFSHSVIGLRSSIQHRNTLASGELREICMDGIPLPGNVSRIKFDATRRRCAHPGFPFSGGRGLISKFAGICPQI
jgi:hypothetical protein